MLQVLANFARSLGCSPAGEQENRGLQMMYMQRKWIIQQRKSFVVFLSVVNST